MRTLILFTVFTASSFYTYGQGQWLVTTKLDTIYGEIFLDTGDPLRADAARIYTDKGKKIRKSHKLLMVHMGAYKNYKTFKIDGRYQFAEIDIMGQYVSRYHYKDPELGKTGNFSLPILINWKGEQYKIGHLTSRKKLAEYLKDCPSLKDQIINRDVKKSKDMEIIILRYNMCIEEIRNRLAGDDSMYRLSSGEKLQIFISDLKSNNMYRGEIISMLKDIEQKLESEEFIPKYLQQVVLSELGDNEVMKTQFLDIIEN